MSDSNNGKKVGIITYWNTRSNYGSLLQNYALQTFLRSLGFETFLIRTDIPIGCSRLDYYKSLLQKNGFFSLTCYFKSRLLCKATQKILSENKNDEKRKFLDFIDKNLNPTKIFRSLSELVSSCPAAEIYITGSDQVWNSYGENYGAVFEQIKAYLLSFAPDSVKKISCAASFGKSSLAVEFENLFKQELSGFDFISCREKSGVEICRQLGFENAVLQQDPTMLLSADEYKKIASGNLVPEKPYILLYLLGNDTDFSIHRLKKIAKSKKLDVVYVPANEAQRINFHRKTYPAVEEWLGLYGNASAVVTNSFHGTVFSLIFNRPFLTVRQSGKFESQNVRIDSLLEDFGLKNRIFSGDFEKLFAPVDFESVNKKLEEIRKYSPFVEYTENQGKSMKSDDVFIKFNEFQENLKNIKYENSIIGILDILGFKNEIESEDESSLRNLNKVILEQKFKNEVLVDFENINFFMLSDTFIVFSDNESIDSAKKVITVLSNIKRSLLHDGFLSRGSVVKGKHFLKNNVLISPAFIKAYLIEEKECVYPRIIIEDVLARQILELKENFPSHFLEQDFDGKFVARSFLQVMEIATFCDEKTWEKSKKDEFKDNFKNQIELYNESLEKCISKINKNSSHLVAKINYVINEYNQLLKICKFYPDRVFLASKHINFVGEKE